MHVKNLLLLKKLADGRYGAIYTNAMADGQGGDKY